MKQPTRSTVFTLIAILMAMSLGFGVWQRYSPVLAGWILPQASGENASGQVNTARVRSADLVITASGEGTLEKVAIPLGFAISGTLVEIAQPGQTVAAGDSLAAFDSQKAELDVQKTELAWEKLSSPSELAALKLEEMQAQAVVADVQQKYNDVVIGPDVAYYKSLLSLAERDYWSALKALENARALAATNKSAASALRRLKSQFNAAELALEGARVNLDWATTYQADPVDALKADGNLQAAQSQLASQTSTIKALLEGETQLLSFENLSGSEILPLQSAWADLEQARQLLAATTLTAPFAGTITQVIAQPGGQVSAYKPVLTLVADAPFTVRFSIDESEIRLLSVGDPFIAVPSAYPNLELPGKVTMIAPAVSNGAQVTVWGEIQPNDLVVKLLPGMNVDVTVTLAESKDTLILPQQAIQRDENGQTYVDLVRPDGSLQPTPVTLGLSDFANIEILSGLNADDEVSTKTATSK